MSQLVRQRIKYLIEYGELYPRAEPASKNFVMGWVLVLLTLNVAEIGLMLYHWWGRL